MRRIHLDAVGGIAGDMFVAAMLDAFPALCDRVLADGRAVLPAEAGTAFLAEGKSGAIRALRFGLAAETAEAACEAAHAGAAHAPVARHGGHSHGAASSAHRHGARFSDLKARIAGATLSPGTAGHAIAILTILAEAESRIHGVQVEAVHFHEIADWDSLLDVVAAGSIAAALEDCAWSVSPLPRGSGLIRSQHGLIPVPAPATIAILAGFDWRDDGFPGERVTPTGAAILKHLATPQTAGPAGRLAGSGTGAGTREIAGLPNILRALVFEEAQGLLSDRVLVIEFEVDDMTGEEIGWAGDRLRALPGVIDLSLAPRFGKKGRPETSFRLLVRPENRDAVAERCFAETTTLGLRAREDTRLLLRRETLLSGDIPVKHARRPGGATAKAESDALDGATLADRRARRDRAEKSDG